ncbi:MAG: spore maturation protein [Bacillota bacterium]
MYAFLTTMAEWIIPVFLLLVFVTSFLRGVRVFDTFVKGAEEGFWIAVKLLPYLVAVYMAVAIFRFSGALEFLAGLANPILNWLGVPCEVLPLMVVRPLSGPAALGMAVDLMREYGADSFIGLLSGTIMGSADTTLYIMALYFSSIGVYKTRYAIQVGLAANFAGIVASIIICNYFFG